MDDLNERITKLEGIVSEQDAELLAYQYILAWLLNTFHDPEAARFLSRFANELEESGKNRSVVAYIDELREKYGLFDAHRSGTQKGRHENN